MNIKSDLISNLFWKKLFKSLKLKSRYEDYREMLAASFEFNPVTDHIMTCSSDVFDIKKAAAMYFWYKLGNRKDTSILRYFDEYKHCIDDKHHEFNSNYGYYAYTQNGLKRCIDYLKEDMNTRQACFCINNNDAMSPNSIDKLCTNTIHFFIRKNTLEMVVQMRSSNFLTLLPYDAFMFTVFYQHVYSALRSSTYYDLQTGLIHMQIGSLHLYSTDIDKYTSVKTRVVRCTLIDDFTDNDWQTKLEDKLIRNLAL